MRCETIRKKLDRFLEGRMPSLDREEIRVHLEACAGCRAEEEGWRAFHRSLDALAEVEVPPGFASRVMERVEAAARERPVRVRRTTPTGAAACAILAVLLVLTLWHAIPAPFDAARATLLQSADLTDILQTASSGGARIGAGFLATGPALAETVPPGGRIALAGGLLAAAALLGLAVRYYRREPTLVRESRS